MNIGLLAVDSRYPNLALMKISSYHKAQGNRVEWYSPLSRYDKVYLAKVFTFTPDYAYFLNADEAERGGTGYDIGKVLPPEIDRAVPDYSLYGIDKRTAYGFLTRGCPNRRKWCVVPQIEGNINPYMEIEEAGEVSLYIRTSAGSANFRAVSTDIQTNNAVVQAMGYACDLNKL